MMINLVIYFPSSNPPIYHPVYTIPHFIRIYPYSILPQLLDFTDVSLPQIDVFFEEKDLVFYEKECQTHIYVRKWDKNKLFRISDLEFDVSSTSLKIEGLTEFDSSSLDQIQKRLKIAFEN